MVKGLFVGAKVRILWSNGWPELAGDEGRITSRSPDCGIRGDSEWRVAPNKWGTHIAPYASMGGGLIFAPNASQLEPILPEGAQPLGYSFEQMMSEFGVKEAVR